MDKRFKPNGSVRYEKGYKFIKQNDIYDCEHHMVWRKFNGEIPDGFIIHHINKIRDDNRIENLMCMHNSSHMRMHARKRENWVFLDGIWKKHCKNCGELKDAYKEYRKKRGICKDCCIKYSKEIYKKNREEILKQKKEYHQNNKEIINFKKAKYREELRNDPIRHEKLKVDARKRYNEKYKISNKIKKE